MCVVWQVNLVMVCVPRGVPGPDVGGEVAFANDVRILNRKGSVFSFRLYSCGLLISSIFLYVNTLRSGMWLVTTTMVVAAKEEVPCFVECPGDGQWLALYRGRSSPRHVVYSGC